MLLMLLILLVLIAGIAFGFYRHIQTLIASAPKPTPATVSSIVAQPSDWQPVITSVGSLSAVQGVDVASQVSGTVESVPVKSGGTVKTGDELVQLNIEPDKAQLASLVAAADLSSKTLKRDQDLLSTRTTSQAVVDADAADLKSKNALVAQAQALIDQKTIKAPFAGDLGIVQVNVGQYLSPGTVIVTLQDLSAMNADFLVPQDKVGNLSVGLPVNVSADAQPDKPFMGKITAIMPKIDVNTRNVTVRATIENPDKLLLPGMFVRVSVDVGKPAQLVTLPLTSVTYNSYGATVFVLTAGADGKSKTAKQVFVTTGQTRGDQVAVLKGIDAGQEVVTAGALKLKTGADVVVDNTVQPPNDANPAPQEK
ncbi:efflux RND transporter periplasmic adaptor subunit [Aestuariivirga litoralis]|nr:efflux RND transporter periplasmic adaptor subunit [Aestuariivirga litoralis]